MKSKFLILLISLLVSVSCLDYLEQPADVAGLSEDIVFSTIEDAEKILAAAYSCMPYGFVAMQANAPWSYGILNYTAPVSALGDESDVATQAENFLHTRYHLGQLTANEIYPFQEMKWDMDWQVIRSGWLFYDNVDRVSDGTSSDYINIRKGEALGIIAIKYYEMFIRLGGLPWVNRYLKIGEEADRSRLSVTATCDSISNLIDRAAEYLPLRNAPGDFGRINKVSMLMLKAKLLLFSASPLFNPSDNTSYYPSFAKQDLLKHDSYDKERWKKAADAAKIAIDAAHSAGYALYNKPDKTAAENYKLVFTSFPETKNQGGNIVADNNKEIILPTRIFDNYEAGEGGYRHRIYSKSNFVSGMAYQIPLQNFVDMYELKDGSVQPADFYSQANPYSKLDERFHTTMFYHSKKVGSFTLDMSPGGDNNPVSHGVAQGFTSYYLAKFFDEKWVVGESGAPKSYWPYMRLAELYLIYAEALLEYNYNGNKSEIFNYLNQIRNRAGQPNIQDCPDFADKETYVRNKIRNERAIELAYENQRYFDLKRWKMGHTNIGGPLTKMVITGTSDNPIFSKQVYEERIFTDKWYLYPLKEADVLKSFGILLQNPGW